MSPDPSGRLPLAELQRRFLAAVLPRPGTPDDGVAGLAPLLKPGPATAAEQVGIYRTNTRENFAAALEAGYPALRAALGPVEFREMAWSFQRRHPARSGNLQWVGRALPDFLAELLPGTGRETLVDLARLEWAVQEVSFAAEPGDRFDLEALARIPPADYGDLRFRFHPAAALVATTHPVLHLWAGARGDRGVEPAGNGEHLLVTRQDRGALIRRLGPGEGAWLGALAGGQGLKAAMAAALAADSDLDPGPLLVTWVQAGVITGFTRVPAAGALGSGGEP